MSELDAKTLSEEFEKFLEKSGWEFNDEFIYTKIVGNHRFYFLWEGAIHVMPELRREGKKLYAIEGDELKDWLDWNAQPFLTDKGLTSSKFLELLKKYQDDCFQEFAQRVNAAKKAHQ